MGKINLRLKLILLSAILLCLTLVVGAVAYNSNKGISTEYTFLITTTLPKAEYINKYYETFLKIRMNVRNLGLPGITPEDAIASEKAVLAGLDEIKVLRASYEKLGFTEGQKEQYDVLLKTWAEFETIGGQVLGYNKEGTPEAKAKMIEIFFTTCPKTADKFTAAVKDLLHFHDKEIAAKTENANKISSDGLTMIILLASIGGLAGSVISFVFARSLAGALNRISKAISISADDTRSGAEVLSSSSMQLSSTSAQAAASLQETVASLEELTSMVKLNTNHAQEAKSLSQKSCETASQGEVRITGLISSMSEIATGSKKIEQIINVIDDIAFQTNLLALNAAVEAARAGEQGKGFSVVADAVRTLAQRSSDAAKDISGLIKENVDKIERGASTAASSGDALKEILLSVRKVSDLNNEISGGSEEQFRGLEQISKAMNQLDHASQGNASSSQEVADSSSKMETQGQTLSSLVHDLSVIIDGKAA